MITISSREERLSKLQKQSGVVSIIVATMLIVIVSLIVIAFAQVSRREQRESLDAQLSTQAYYAAETGVNAAIATINATDPSTLVKKDTCPAGGSFNFTYALDPPTNDVALTCLHVDPNPQSLNYQLDTTTAQVVPIIPASGQTIKSLTFSWDKQDGLSPNLGQANCLADVNASTYAWTLPPESTWNLVWNCPFALVRADLVDTSNGFSRAALLDNTKNNNVTFMVPVTNPGRYFSPSTNLRGISLGKCDDNTCTMTLENLNRGQMYLRLGAIYRSASVTIKGTDQSDKPLIFTRAQARIDATGRAQDVLRRIVVSAPLFNSNSALTQALVSGDSVCKRFGVYAGYYQDLATGIDGC